MTIGPMLHRIGHHGPVAADLETLSALHRAWRRAVPYENLDIQLGRPISLEPDALFDNSCGAGAAATATSRTPASPCCCAWRASR